MIIYLAMFFAVLEILSLIFNQYFVDVQLFNFVFPLNISVIFFCMGFFVLDLVTEIYNKKIADKLIYGKIFCQIIFVVLGEVGVFGARLQNTQLSQIITTTPIIIFYGIIASVVGYKITTHIMQKLKVRYDGRFLMMRYLCSTLPGEIVFSLIFSSLSFSAGKSFSEFVMIFLTLILVKIILSLLFSILVVPITNIIKYFTSHSHNEALEFIPFA
jgi:uncharacterized integral membrane protein (TIGR00697 family)